MAFKCYIYNNLFAFKGKKMKKIHLLTAVSALGLLMASDMALAHVGYGTSLYDQPTNTYAGAGSGGLNPTVSSNAGWISGLSNNSVNRTGALDTYGDTHNNRFRFFTLTQTSQVNFSVTGAANPVWGNCNGAATCAAGTTNNPFLVGTSASILNPGVSIYSGVVPASSHDGVGDKNGLTPDQISALQSTAIVGLAVNTAGDGGFLQSQPGFAPWSPFYDANDEILAEGGAANIPGNRDKWGVFKADGNFTMGNNNGLVSGVAFLGAVADQASGTYADGVVDNTVNWSGILNPGTYTLTIGGTDANDLFTLYTQALLGVPGPLSTTCASFGDSGCNATAFSDQYNALRAARNMNISFSVTAVPVPAAVWLFGSAIVGLVGLGRRKSIVA
jgi:hypothetical protein